MRIRRERSKTSYFGKNPRQSRWPRHSIRPIVEQLEDRTVPSVVFEDINPNFADTDNIDPDRASMGRVNGLASVGRQDLGTANNDIFYAASEWGGIYKSTDGGVRWSFLHKHVPVVTWDVEVDPQNTSRLYATSFYDGKVDSLSGINFSTDAGATWIHPLTADPDPAFEGTTRDNTPQPGYACNNPRDEVSAFGIAIQPDAPQNVFVGTNCGLARSTNSGITWQFIVPDATPVPLANADIIRDVAVQAGGIVDVVGRNGHLRSTDGGNTWQASTLPTPQGLSVAVSPDENYVILVVGTDNQLYESDDGGTSWVQLGHVDPVNGFGRIPFVATNQKTTGFDAWTGGVSLYRLACNTPAAPAPTTPTAIATARCPQGAQPSSPPAPPTPVPAGWFGGFTRSGLGAGTGAHDDVGDVVFNTEVATDAVVLQFSSDGGVYRSLPGASPSPTGTQLPNDLVWEQPNVGPHALWLFGMAGVNIPANDNTEHLYFGLQDNGVFGADMAGAPTAAAAADWHIPACCDGFDLAADATQVFYTRGSFNTGKQFRLFTSNIGMASGENPATEPPNGIVTRFNFAESLDSWGTNQYALLMVDCTVGTTQGCVAPNTGDGGVFVTNNILAANPWTELQEPATMNSANLEEVQVALSGGNLTFYVQVGGGDRRGGDQLWRWTGDITNPLHTADTTRWVRIDTNTLTNTAAPMTGGIGFFSVNATNPNQLYAFNSLGGSPQMVFSNDQGANWTIDPKLTNLMTGFGSFKATNTAGPTNFTGFAGYSQPSMVAIDGEDGRNITAGGWDSGVFLSQDGGTSWRLLSDPYGEVDDPATAHDDIPHIPRPLYTHFDHEPAGTLRLFVGTQGRGVWRMVISGTAFNKEPDRFEPNNTIGTSTVLGSLQKITERDLTIHDTSDVDFFQYTAQDTGKLIVNIFFDGEGELDLRVRDKGGNIIAAGSESFVAGGRLREKVVIPVVTQEEYYIEVVSSVQHTNEYDMEIENFPAPVPDVVDLDPKDDTGVSDTDDNTFDTRPLIRIQADLKDFFDMGIPVLTASEATGGFSGAAVEIFVNGLSVGFADPIQPPPLTNPDTGKTLFQFTLDDDQLDDNFAIFPPGPAARGWLNFVTAAVRIFDGQLPTHKSGRSQLSEPLRLVFDPNAPAAPTIALLPTSDSAAPDGITNVNPPAFGGTGEINTKVTVFANGVFVGEGFVGSDCTSGSCTDGIGAWEVTVEPLADNVYAITAKLEDLAGNLSPASATVAIILDTPLGGGLPIPCVPPAPLPCPPGAGNFGRPQRPTVDLHDFSDTGRNDQDNVTILFEVTLHVTSEPGSEVNIKDGNTIIDTYTSTGEDDRTVMLVTRHGTKEGLHLVSAESTDVAGNRSDQSEELPILVDFTAPPIPTITIDPARTDTGVEGYPATFVDRITSDTATGFFGTAEADAIVRLFAKANCSPPEEPPQPCSKVFDGETVAIPLDGNKAFPAGQWNQAGILDLNHPSHFPQDGTRTMTATAEDLAGNVSNEGLLRIFVDTAGPQVDSNKPGVNAVHITDNPATTTRDEEVFDLFDPKPSTDGPPESGPTPRINQLSIEFRDLPNRDTANFPNYAALFEAVAEHPGHYVLKGDHVGAIPILDVEFTAGADNDGEPARGTVVLTFFDSANQSGKPLPDDRYTLTLSDTLVDAAGNSLDGENNARQPLEAPLFPTGDLQPGGDFVARFTVDSRPEIATYCCGSAFVDINGNGSFDPTGEDNDYVNRDIIFDFATYKDQYFAGDFAPANATKSSGFDKLGAYGHGVEQSGPARLLLDFDSDGVKDHDVLSGVGDGYAVAGDFSCSHPGDEVGIFVSGKWNLDVNGDNILTANEKVIQGDMRGTPIVGDFDGDGFDDLGVYKDAVFSFDLNRLPPAVPRVSCIDGLSGNTEKTIKFGFFGAFETPIAADINLDGIDDIGLFIPERNGVPPSEAAEWYFLISTNAESPDPAKFGTVAALDHPFKPVPFGTDLYFQYGDELARPLIGNFDPPVNPVEASNVVPVVNAGPDKTIAKGTALRSTGSFADFDGTSWSATVNYGDGTGDQPLAIGSDRSFQFNHVYRQPGRYFVAVNVMDDDGSAGSDSMAVTVKAPAVVQRVVINNGGPQRSMVRSIQVTFSDIVSLSKGAFVVTRQNGWMPAVNVTTSVVNGKTVALIKFTGTGIIGGSLLDGNYTLTIAGGKIRDSIGQMLDGNRDGVAGGAQIDAFFRYYGDSDGDRDVDSVDLWRFRRAPNEPTLRPVFDFNGDGYVNGTDYAQFIRRNGRKLP